MTNFTKQKTETLIINKGASYVLIALILAVAFSYVYFANTAVRTLTALEKTKKQMQSLSIEVSEMESKRLAIENNVNIAMALQLGFVEVNHPTFIVKQKTALSLRIN
jgi:hypothetical protein